MKIQAWDRIPNVSPKSRNLVNEGYPGRYDTFLTIFIFNEMER